MKRYNEWVVAIGVLGAGGLDDTRYLNGKWRVSKPMCLESAIALANEFADQMVENNPDFVFQFKDRGIGKFILYGMGITVIVMACEVGLVISGEEVCFDDKDWDELLQWPVGAAVEIAEKIKQKLESRE